MNDELPEGIEVVAGGVTFRGLTLTKDETRGLYRALRTAFGWEQTRTRQETLGWWVLENPNLTVVRVGGDVVCADCGVKYVDHPSPVAGFHLLCNGRIGKT